MAIAQLGVRSSNSSLPRSLLDRGFEVKTLPMGNHIERIVLSPQGQPFGHEATYTGDLPQDPVWRDWCLKMRWTATPDYERAFWAYVSACGKTRDEQIAHMLLEPDERKALVGGIDTAGGVLVPPDWSAQILARLAENNLAMQLADVRPCSRDTLAVPRVLPSPNYPSAFSGGFEVSAVGESPSQNDFDPVFGEAFIGIRKFRARTRISNDLLQDAPFVRDQLATLAARDLGALYTKEFTVGPGSSTEWLGILNAPGIDSTDVTGSTAHSISNTELLPGSAVAIRALRDTLPPQYWQNARWLMSGSIRAAIEALVDGAGRQILAMSRDGDNFMLDVHPYHTTNFMPANGAAGPVLAFGDFHAAYVVAQRADMTVRLDTETYGDTGETQIVLWARSGGAPTNVDAIRLGTLS
jgi:HK97 family phage major capsid protein